MARPVYREDLRCRSSACSCPRCGPQSIPEQQRGEFLQAAPPRQEFMRSVRRYIEHGVDAGILDLPGDLVGAGLRLAARGTATPAATIATQFLAAVADEHQFHLLLE